MFGQKASKDVAKERLRLVLVHDRTRLSPEFMDELKEKLIDVIGDFVDVDERGLEVELSREEEQVALVANIPIRGIRHRRERGRF
jgi:cell division topological specificity factor